MNDSVSYAGSLVTSDMIKPLSRSFRDTLTSFIPTSVPGPADYTSLKLTSTVLLITTKLFAVLSVFFD